MSLQETSIYVSNEDYDKAVDLLGDWIKTETKEIEDEKDSSEETKSYNYLRYGLIALIFGLPVIIVVCIIIASNI